MNKTELAKLLFQHKDIKALFESQEFDASTINKVIAQEIMRENEHGDGENSGWSTEHENNQKLIQKLQQDLKELEATKQEFIERLREIRQELLDARARRDRDETQAAASERRQVNRDVALIQDKIDAIHAKLTQAGQLASQTASPKDDEAVANITQQAKDKLTQSADNLERSASSEEAVVGIQKDIETELTNLEEPIQQVAQQSAQAGDSGGDSKTSQILKITRGVFDIGKQFLPKGIATALEAGIGLAEDSQVWIEAAEFIANDQFEKAADKISNEVLDTIAEKSDIEMIKPDGFARDFVQKQMTSLLGTALEQGMDLVDTGVEAAKNMLPDNAAEQAQQSIDQLAQQSGEDSPADDTPPADDTQDEGRP